MRCAALLIALGCGQDDDQADGDADTDADAGDTAPPHGSDATLAVLDLGVSLDPPFDPTRRYYVVPASALADPFTVTAAPTDPAATVVITLETIDGADVAAGASLSPLADHRVRVDVTAADGGTTGTYAVGLLPDDFPAVTVTTPGTPSPGWTLVGLYAFVPEAGKWLGALDERGIPGWWRRVDRDPFDLRVSRDDRLTWTANVAGPVSPVDGYVLDADYATVATSRALPIPGLVLANGDVHEFDLQADGSVVTLAVVSTIEDLTPWGAGSNVSVLHGAVEIIDPAGALVFSWSAIGLFDYDDLPAAHRAAMGDGWEAEHLNSVELDPSDGHVVASSRNASQVVKIARFDDTIAGRFVPAGEIAWRLGGPGSDFTFVGDARESGWEGFSEQHTARMTGPDTIMVFDNSSNMDLGRTGASRFAEYELDTTSWTATLVASYESPTGRIASALGSVQRTTDGHTIIGWGSLADGPDLTELDAAGVVVQEITFAEPLHSYRAWRAEGDPMNGTWQDPY